MRKVLVEAGLRVLTAIVFVLAAPVMALSCVNAAWATLFRGTDAIDGFFETFRWYFDRKEPR